MADEPQGWEKIAQQEQKKRETSPRNNALGIGLGIVLGVGIIIVLILLVLWPYLQYL